MPAARRRKRGPPPGTGGRPPLVAGQRAVTTSLRLGSEDRARLDRLRALWGHSGDGETLRHALEFADTMMRE